MIRRIKKIITSRCGSYELPSGGKACFCKCEKQIQRINTVSSYQGLELSRINCIQVYIVAFI